MKKIIAVLILCMFCYPIISACQHQPASEPQGTPIPTPSEGKATLAGILVKAPADDQQEKPYAEVRLLAGSTITDSEGNTVGAQVSLMSSPKTRSDTQGRFVFTDLEPGTYILAVQMPPLELLKLNDPQTGEDMYIELQPGEVVDLGKLSYTNLPYWLP